MITNDRQYRSTKAQAARLRSAIDDYDALVLVGQGLDPIIVEAQRRGLDQQLRELQADIGRYEALRSGTHDRFTAKAITEIGERLIECRIAQNLTQRELALRLGMREQQVQRYEQERYQSASLSRIAEVGRALELVIEAELRVAAGNADVGATRPFEFDPKKLPIQQMKKRGWLRQVRAETSSPNPSDVELAAAFITQSAGGNHVNALHRQNLKLAAKADPYALLAWKARVLHRARQLRGQVPEGRGIDPIFVRKLVSLSQDADGVVASVDVLRSAGIIVVFEQHLPSTYLDGAALLLDNSVPVIALTLRHDRLDNFWFVLLHELGHVVRHRDNGLRDGFFDDDASPSVAQQESEADEFALNALIPDELWKNSFVRFTKSRAEVVKFASRIGVGPAVVAGRIRNERGDYSLFSDLVGSGEVKKRISEANLMA
jgi:HTH-type transcriptional regulator/antitoxin HigA